MPGESSIRQRVKSPKDSTSKRQQLLPKFARRGRTHLRAITNNSPSFQKTKGVIFFLCACPFFIYFLSVHIVHTSLKNPTHDEDSYSSLQSSHQEDTGTRNTANTVIGVGINYNLEDYKRFVGSLRDNNFKGNIIIGLQISRKQVGLKEDANTEIVNYLSTQKVLVKYIETVKCNITGMKMHGKEFCIEGYPNIILNSGEESYLFAKDWLSECTQCQEGSLLMASIEDVSFQSDPFDFFHDIIGEESSAMLHLFETTFNTKDRRANLLSKCSKFNWEVPLLSSVTLMSNSSWSYSYAESMLNEMNEFRQRSGLDGCDLDDSHGLILAAQNHLFYNGGINIKIHRHDQNNYSMSFL